MLKYRGQPIFHSRRIQGFVIRQISIQLYEDWLVHRRDWTRPGFRALAVHRFGAMLLKRKQGILTRALSIFYMSMFRYVRNHYGIELPATTIVGRRLQLAHQHGIVIHPKTVFGDDCIVQQNVTIGESNLSHKGEVPRFGNRVSLGTGAVVLGAVVIGDDVVIGPNTTITTSIPAGTTVCAPAPRHFKIAHWNFHANPLLSSSEQESVASLELDGRNARQQHE
jgi:serine O-acetyltransferase